MQDKRELSRQRMQMPICETISSVSSSDHHRGIGLGASRRHALMFLLCDDIIADHCAIAFLRV